MTKTRVGRLARASGRWLRGHWIDVLLPPAAFLIAAGLYRQFSPPALHADIQTQQHIDAASAARQRGDTETAIRELTTAAEVAPDNYPMLFTVAIQLDKAGQHERAALLVERALKLPAGSTDAQLHTNYINLLRAWDRAGRYDQIQRILNENVLRRWPDSPQANYWEGIALMRTERAGDDSIDRAAGRFRRALDVDPTYLDARYQYAVALSRLGRLDEAAEAYRAVLATAPQFPGTHHGLAQVLRRQGRAKAADAVLAEFGQLEAAQRRMRYLETQRSLRQITGDQLRELADLYQRAGRTADAETARTAASTAVAARP